MRRAKRFYRKATGRRYSKKGGRFHKHTYRRQKRRGYQGHARGGYFQKRKRGHFIPYKGKKYWIDMEHVPEEAVEAYFKRGSSGRKNPRGRDGNIMLCHECGSDEHLIAKCPMKKNSLTSAHYSHGQDIVTPNGVMQYATPTYVHAGVIHASVPYGSTGDSGVETPMHEQFATETDEDPTIIGDYDPSFQLILRRHGLTAMPRDSDPDREWLEVLEAGDTSISMPSSLLNDLDHDPSHPTTTVMYASPALVQSTTASSTSRPASSTKDHSPSKSPTGAHSPKSTSPVTDNST